MIHSTRADGGTQTLSENPVAAGLAEPIAPRLKRTRRIEAQTKIARPVVMGARDAEKQSVSVRRYCKNESEPMTLVEAVALRVAKAPTPLQN